MVFRDPPTIPSWLDEQLPVLGGKTPRQAARTKRGQEHVVRLLHDQENSTAKLPGGDRVDFSVAYRELGLLARAHGQHLRVN